MSTLDVKIPDKMDDDVEAFLEDNPHSLNKSELVRDAIRHLIERPRLSDRTLDDTTHRSETAHRARRRRTSSR